MHHRRPSLLALFAAAFLVGFLVSCTVNFSDSIRYSCKIDGDCGGDGFLCAFRPSGVGVCCKPTGSEVCDKVDNDCDGLTDNTGKADVCNGLDDDCNGTVDDGFDLTNNISNCGTCGHQCLSSENCRAGECVMRPETSCFDLTDNNDDGKTDCEDPTCEGRQCRGASLDGGIGGGCTCHDLVKAEDVCTDGVDNETDGKTDCLDPDCNGKTCRSGGCTCVPDGGMIETDCSDALDNDNDGVKDCLDTDCVDKYCTPPDIYFTCTNDQRCRCNGGVQVAEVGSVLCRDAIDNNCDGKIDCAESSCVGQSCLPDAGSACQCAMGGKHEMNCTNGVDDDGDTKVDCADLDDCVMSACPLVDGGMGSCTAGACN